MYVQSISDLTQFDELACSIAQWLLLAPEVIGNAWQSSNARKEMLITHEITTAVLEMPIGEDEIALAKFTGANMPWAEDHFRERVSGQPLNPPPSEAWWPYAQRGNAEHKTDQVFSHTYPERFWPKFANAGGVCADSHRVIAVPHVGIRYAYGDLGDVIGLLRKDPHTRQAYLPVWFPEDTGAVSGQRVPCTLGYHFLMRDDILSMTYHIRSCDYMRHWRDDIYMAGRLLQWVSRQLPGVTPGKLVMHIGSLHIFKDDKPPLRQWADRMAKELEANRCAKLMEAL